jgi:hypothetical protein
MNATCLMKFALNYDPNAEINWRRRPGAVYADTNSAATASHIQHRKSTIEATK